MALADEVTGRYPAKRLQQLTNPGDESATAIDTTILGYAVTDVQADFLTYCATTYDNSEAQHVAVAVRGVLAKLYLMGEAPGAKARQDHDAYIEALRDLAKVTGRDRVTPATQSVLTPTPERSGTETVRPDTDRPHYEDLIPDPPA